MPFCIDKVNRFCDDGSINKGPNVINKVTQFDENDLIKWRIV